MRIASTVAGILLIVIGGVWTGQGANLIGGSFMTGERTWLVIGGVTVLAGLALLGWANARPRRP